MAASNLPTAQSQDNFCFDDLLIPKLNQSTYFPTPVLSESNSFLDSPLPYSNEFFSQLQHHSLSHPPINPSLFNPSPFTSYQSPFMNSADSIVSSSPVIDQLNYFEPLEQQQSQIPAVNPSDTVTLTFAQLSALIAASNKLNEESTSTPTPQKEPSAGKAQKSFPCTFPGCGKIFSRKFNLHTHTFTHDPNRPRDFVCQENGCKKTFVRIHDLQRHATTHLPKENVCLRCDKKFGRSDALARHIKSKCTSVKVP
ncbi:hypothetical protein HK099_007494 [Clydaea vesicula]|uniref:C2H2-type domain-containing protein n=1 Tax=Clydaea vesicula TaxID=447962 RepID=A0AAD5XXX1_9FUNG|nr:hypothetical protein HK099_007494 [Clydaea vesicula]KAJ3377673.1 hypothetical protein HDU92_008080 [Lobulomyces angularis]